MPLPPGDLGHTRPRWPKTVRLPHGTKALRGAGAGEAPEGASTRGMRQADGLGPSVFGCGGEAVPNASNVAEVEAIKGRLEGSVAALLTEYRGLKVAELGELRASLRGSSTEYRVLKNTLTSIAVREAGCEDLVVLLQGPTAVAFVHGDPVQAAKDLADFARTHPSLIVKGGVMDGKVLGADEVRRLATLESGEVLLARLAGLLQASAQQTVNLPAPPLRRGGRPARRVRRLTMAKLSNDDLLDAFKEMTLLELSEFVKQFEETFNVSAAAPVAVAAGPAGAGAGATATEEAEEQTEFDGILTGTGEKKIQVIKEVRALTSLGLKEAKDLVDSAPKPVLERVPKDQADKAKAQLEGAGASVELKEPDRGVWRAGGRGTPRRAH